MSCPSICRDRFCLRGGVADARDHRVDGRVRRLECGQGGQWSTCCAGEVGARGVDLLTRGSDGPRNPPVRVGQRARCGDIALEVRDEGGGVRLTLGQVGGEFRNRGIQQFCLSDRVFGGADADGRGRAVARSDGALG